MLYLRSRRSRSSSLVPNEYSFDREPSFAQLSNLEATPHASRHSPTFRALLPTRTFRTFVILTNVRIESSPSILPHLRSFLAFDSSPPILPHRRTFNFSVYYRRHFSLLYFHTVLISSTDSQNVFLERNSFLQPVLSRPWHHDPFSPTARRFAYFRHGPIFRLLFPVLPR